MAFKLKSPINLLTKEGRERRKKKRNFKKRVRELKKANKVIAGQNLEQVGPKHYRDVDTHRIYSDPKNVIKKDSQGNVMDYDYKQRKSKFKRIK